MTVTEVSKLFEMSADTLRYYERIGLIPQVHRTKGGVRDYTEEDLRWVEFAKCMRSAGLQIEALIDYVALFQQGDATREARKQILIEQRDQLVERQKELAGTIERLNGKIDRYDHVVVVEKGLTIPENKTENK